MELIKRIVRFYNKWLAIYILWENKEYINISYFPFLRSSWKTKYTSSFTRFYAVIDDLVIMMQITIFLYNLFSVLKIFVFKIEWLKKKTSTLSTFELTSLCLVNASKSFGIVSNEEIKLLKLKKMTLGIRGSIVTIETR